MANGSLGPAQQALLKAIGQQTVESLSDGQLLERFVAGQDQQAFEGLVRRHGPMVLGVCQRILQDRHDAEDACQAAFFVLARKAASIRAQESIGGWLYQVAYRVAVRARAAMQRRAEERWAVDMAHAEAGPAVHEDEDDRLVPERAPGLCGRDPGGQKIRQR
jgi:DNA-directed RNA polymerase specialized sigma24 family protein